MILNIFGNFTALGVDFRVLLDLVVWFCFAWSVGFCLFAIFTILGLGYSVLWLLF